MRKTKTTSYHTDNFELLVEDIPILGTKDETFRRFTLYFMPDNDLVFSTTDSEEMTEIASIIMKAKPWQK